MTTTKNKKPDTPVNFEKSFSELETIVSNLEDTDLPLDEALKTFEKGIQLTSTCQKALADAEQKVQVLMQKNNSPE